MAYEKYIDTPLSNFPEQEDNWSRMSNLSVSLLSVAKQYSDLYNTGDINAANELLEQYPDLKSALFTPERWNQIRDAIIALQRFFLEDVESMIVEVANNTVGIDDEATGLTENTNAYSVAKVNELLLEFSEMHQVTLPVSGWSASTPYTQRVDLEWLKDEHSPLIAIDDSQPKATQKAQSKQFFKHVARAHTNDGYLIFECETSKPTIDLVLSIKGR